MSYPKAMIDYLEWKPQPPQPKEGSEIVKIFHRDFYDDIQTKLGLNSLNYNWFNNILMNQKHTNIRFELKLKQLGEKFKPFENLISPENYLLSATITVPSDDLDFKQAEVMNIEYWTVDSRDYNPYSFIQVFNDYTMNKNGFNKHYLTRAHFKHSEVKIIPFGQMIEVLSDKLNEIHRSFNCLIETFEDPVLLTYKEQMNELSRKREELEKEEEKIRQKFKDYGIKKLSMLSDFGV